MCGILWILGARAILFNFTDWIIIMMKWALSIHSIAGIITIGDEMYAHIFLKINILRFSWTVSDFLFSKYIRSPFRSVCALDGFEMLRKNCRIIYETCCWLCWFFSLDMKWKSFYISKYAFIVAMLNANNICIGLASKRKKKRIRNAKKRLITKLA